MMEMKAFAFPLHILFSFTVLMTGVNCVEALWIQFHVNLNILRKSKLGYSVHIHYN
jgi:hypothetical protein